MKRIGLISKLKDRVAIKEAIRLSEFIKSMNVNVIYEKKLADIVGVGKGVAITNMVADLIVTLGGDGTVLRTCMKIPHSNTPILAINLGKRGFLTEVGPEDAENAIKKYLTGEYSLEEHSKLSLYINKIFLGDALNEVLITSFTPSKLLRLIMSLDKKEIIRFTADGIIISTPTGSTAHALSAGGPVLHQELNAFNIVPICPMGPVKSIVVADSHDIMITLLREDIAVTVTIDGSFTKQIKPSDKIIIKKSKNKAYFVRFNQGHLKRRLNKLPLRDSLIIKK